MDHPPVIAFRNLDPSPALETIIRKRVDRLVKLDDRITALEVTVEAPQKRKAHGRVFRVHVDVHRPGPAVEATRQYAHGSATDDATLAVNRAFSAAEKALKRQKERMKGVHVKHHPPVLHGMVTLVEPELGWGQVRADDGREVYFQKDGFTEDVWDRVERGARLRFREMDGEKGPYAVSISLAE